MEEEKNVEEVVEQPVVETPAVQEPVLENNAESLPVGTNPVPPKKKSKKGLIITIIILILLIAGGITAWFMMNNNSDSDEPDTEENSSKKDKKKDNKEDKKDDKVDTIDFYVTEANANCVTEKLDDSYELYYQYKCATDDCYLVSKYVLKGIKFVIHDGDNYLFDFDTEEKTKLNIELNEKSATHIIADRFLAYSDGKDTSASYAIYDLEKEKNLTDYNYATVETTFDFDNKSYIVARKYSIPGPLAFINIDTGEEASEDDTGILAFIYSYYYISPVLNAASSYINTNIDYVKTNGYNEANVNDQSGSQTPKAYGVISYTKTDTSLDIKYAYIYDTNPALTEDCLEKRGASGYYYGSCEDVVRRLYNENKTDVVYTLHLLWYTDHYNVDSVTFE